MTLLMYKKNFFHPLLFLIACLATASCSKGTLNTYGVAYQSVRTDNYKNKIPEDAKIVVAYNISSSGKITPVVYNKTDEIMIIDQTMSFFVNSSGSSTSYYDPTVRTTATTDIASGTSGASVNLGAIGGALGIGGPLGTALSGINLGGSETTGTSTTNTTYFSDQPRISLSPRSKGAMSKSFQIHNVGFGDFSANTSNSYSWLIENSDSQKNPQKATTLRTIDCSTRNESPIQFSVCISYSLDNGETFEKIVTDFYVNSQMIEIVKQKGKVNDALRRIYQNKPDAINEQWWTLRFLHNISSNGVYDNVTRGILYDYR